MTSADLAEGSPLVHEW